MSTRRKTEIEKARGQFARAFVQLGRSIPATLRANWRNVLMPWRMLPMPVALALVALVGLAMVLDTGDDIGATVGGTLVPAALDCEEDEVIGFVGIPDLLVCVHVDSLLTPTPTPTPTATPTSSASATDTPTPTPTSTGTPTIGVLP